IVRKRGPRLVAVTQIPTNAGLVQPVEEIGAICRENGVLYLVDACQWVGQRVLETERICCDFSHSDASLVPPRCAWERLPLCLRQGLCRGPRAVIHRHARGTLDGRRSLRASPVGPPLRRLG